MEYRRIFDDDKYTCFAKEHCECFAAAQPFPHVVLDDFIPEDLCDAVLKEFPTTNSSSWLKFNDATGLKLASDVEQDYGAATSMLLDQLNGAGFLNFLQRLSGISEIIPDPYYGGGYGGGRHQIPHGGFLKVHADFTRHPTLNLDRRLNVLIYLNQDWLDDYGGQLELWDNTMTECVQRILPIFNRCVIFATSDVSYHGHPEPLACPEGMTRKSIAQYYYTNGRSDDVTEAPTTIYRDTPEELARMESLGYRCRATTAQLLENAASLAHKPAGLLRRLAGIVQPRH